MSRQIWSNCDLRDEEISLDPDQFSKLLNSNCVMSMSTPHRIVGASSDDDLEHEVRFIAQLPLRNYVVHAWSSKDTDGYCGMNITFLTQNGSFETVKRPFLMSFGWKDYKKLVKAIQLPELYNVVCKISVGTYTAEDKFKTKLVNIVLEEQVMSFEPIYRESIVNGTG